jgi:hypothetical protein
MSKPATTPGEPSSWLASPDIRTSGPLVPPAATRRRLRPRSDPYRHSRCQHGLVLIRVVAVIVIVGATGCAKGSSSGQGTPGGGGVGIQVRPVVQNQASGCERRSSNPPEHSSAPIATRDGKECLLVGPADMTIRKASAATASTNQNGVTLEVRLMASDVGRFREITSQRSKAQLSFVFEGELLSAPFLQVPITDGHFDLTTSSWTEQDVRRLANALDGEQHPSPSPTPPPALAISPAAQVTDACSLLSHADAESVSGVAVRPFSVPTEPPEAPVHTCIYRGSPDVTVQVRVAETVDNRAIVSSLASTPGARKLDGLGQNSVVMGDGLVIVLARETVRLEVGVTVNRRVDEGRSISAARVAVRHLEEHSRE